MNYAAHIKAIVHKSIEEAQRLAKVAWHQTERTCVKKTAVGNVYDTCYEAWRRARKMMQKLPGHKRRIEPFECACCGKWHIGKKVLEDNDGTES